MSQSFHSHSAAETERIGEALAGSLRPGDVIAYRGGLGAGKTAFTRGLARGLGVSEPVTSPTYTVVNEYLSGRLPLFHFDLYRLRSDDELFELGWEDYLDRGGVCAVEWSENAPESMQDAICVSIERDEDAPDSRIITVTGGEAPLRDCRGQSAAGSASRRGTESRNWEFAPVGDAFEAQRMRPAMTANIQ